MIVFEPAYDSYIPNILVNGAVPVTVPLEYPSYRIDWEKVRAAKTEKTKAIILNSPHNPTGAVLSPEDIEELRKLVHDTNIFIVSDEVYEHIILDGLPHRSILGIRIYLKEVLFVFHWEKFSIAPDGNWDIVWRRNG